MDRAGLAERLRRVASAAPDREMVVDRSGTVLTYGAFDHLSDRVAALLAERGVERGDRVGIVLPKSIDSLAVVFATLKLGAVYVPIDATAPIGRIAQILADCTVRLAFVTVERRDDVESRLEEHGLRAEIVSLDEVGGGRGVEPLLGEARASAVDTAPDDLAYILYTSGSTGRPKGVMLTHGNALAFVDWAVEELGLGSDDRFSSHAPFHFDLSVFDLFAAVSSGGRLTLIDELTGRSPEPLADLIERERLSVWYSTPSTLRLLVEHGELERRRLDALRLVLFAGEVFPVKHLRELVRRVPDCAYYNLYGPTETNVCTSFELPATIPESRRAPYPIGRPSSGAATRVVDAAGVDVEPGREGDLWVHGPSVMVGYWDRPRRTAAAFRLDAEGRRWYATGDRVVEHEEFGYEFVGRRDRMVKRRGYRIELDEIEVALYRADEVVEAAVVSRSDDGEVRIEAFVAVSPGAARSTIRLKRFLSEQLPLYMIPDRVAFLDELPKTSTDKIDYQRLLGVS